MRCGWGSAAVLTALLALGACNRGEDAGLNNDARAEAAAQFLENNGKEDGVTTLPSGLQYRVVESGPSDGPHPDPNDLVRVDYEGTLTDGTVFDSSFEKGQPMVTAPEGVPPGGIIPAWTEALQLMRPGDEWIIYVPPALGYRDRGSGQIPPNSVLVFRIKLHAVSPVPGRGAPHVAPGAANV